ncbi:MAG: RNA polymerase sigma factor [bacterium]|nr:RNA polymerase sigma factor [bacterium]
MDDKQQQFAAVFEKHSNELFRHCTMRLSDRERALELTQETFLRAWKYAERGEEVRQWRALLYRILNNLIVDEYRKHTSQSLDALLENEETQVAVEGALLRDEVDALESAMVRFDSARALVALKELTEPYRTALVCRYIDGLSPREIAECMQESENAISVRIHRGLKKLRTVLK